MDAKEFDSLLERYNTNTCTAAEKRLVEHWMNNLQSQDIDIPEHARDAIKNNLWVKIDNQVLAESSAKPGFSYWKVAAAVALLISCSFLLYQYFTPATTGDAPMRLADGNLIRFINTTREPVRVPLKDGSAIVVQPGGELRYPETFGSQREVFLSGEAFFDIARDPAHPFLVHANELTTRVLGTSFVIKAYADRKEIVVSVRTGKVSVFPKALPGSITSSQEIILTPNQQVVYKRQEGIAEKQLVESPAVLVPVPSTTLVYTNEPVAKLFRTLETMYGVTIDFDEHAIEQCRITTELTDEGLFERMEVICHVIDATYYVEDGHIRVESRGCIAN
ncbi:FecR domain-containing protein [Fulvivirgaceae bacterium PWU5]|uniref:FecR domain-containing protein n=1 Tax=Dawidia cretensis TaxID=2782350 RepID=A0AAP2GVV7_9BACT|nr:FecR family protein [Dawidia cretensis]MBT1709647.1 FecR domain-containing protein [Dawidia cretensis]